MCQYSCMELIPHLILFGDYFHRHIPQAAASMKEGKWDRKKVWNYLG